jgi:hypothetical protein
VAVVLLLLLPQPAERVVVAVEASITCQTCAPVVLAVVDNR